VPIERRVQSGPLKLLQSVEVELGGLAGQGRGGVRDAEAGGLLPAILRPAARARVTQMGHGPGATSARP